MFYSSQQDLAAKAYPHGGRREWALSQKLSSDLPTNSVPHMHTHTLTSEKNVSFFKLFTSSRHFSFTAAAICLSNITTQELAGAELEQHLPLGIYR